MATWSPQFFVSDKGGSSERLSFSRLSEGPADGAVMVTYYRGEDRMGVVLIDAAGWASVLAHVSAAPHDGETFAVAQDFHAGRILPKPIGAKSS